MTIFNECRFLHEARHFILVHQTASFSFLFHASTDNQEMIVSEFNRTMTVTSRHEPTHHAPLIEVWVESGNHIGSLIFTNPAAENEIVSMSEDNRGV